MATHDEDGVPVKWLVFMSAVSPNKAVSQKEQAELMAVCDMLYDKKKYQKAADLLYGCILSDYHNEPLHQRWKEFIAKTNEQNVDIARQEREKQKAREARIEAAVNGGNAAMTETERWKDLKEQKLLPKASPNWHLGKLKPWQGPEAMDLGCKYKTRAMALKDPFQKVFELEEASKMFNKVLEIRPHDDEARRLLSECCAAMNVEYQRMKTIKRQVKTLDPSQPFTKVGDFLQSQNKWVKNVRG